MVVKLRNAVVLTSSAVVARRDTLIGPIKTRQWKEILELGFTISCNAFGKVYADI